MDSYSLRSVSDLPGPFSSTFSFRYFNSLQSECFSECFLSDTNMVISAPTGSGKTVLFELCILRLLSRFLTQEGKFVHIKGTLKTIYIAPSKALVQEKLRDWNQKLGSWGINCLELTGDSEFYNPSNLQEADIILTTPEKFDAVTRYRIKDGGLSFFSDIGLLLIDEVHLLNDPRGASLEAVVSRIKMLARNPEMNSSPLAHVRFLAVSATIPNIEDLGKSTWYNTASVLIIQLLYHGHKMPHSISTAEWLMVPIHGIKRFGEEMRPVKLTTRVFGYAPAKNDFLFERRNDDAKLLADILMQYSRGKSALVFCSTRKGAQEAALRLSQTAITFGHSNPFMKSQDQHERLKEASLSFSDKQMQSCILFGVGYHNGGLCLKDRNLIEGLFLRGDVQVLCTTNTLAHGVNLPAHTVVIKSTQYFNKEKGLYVEYDRSMILQMCGRAGRPPFDDSGMVIIMTRRETVHLYENLLNGCEMVESQLLSCMTEHLAAEIVQLTISDISQAIEWMKCSYLYVRMRKNPENYAVKKNLPGECLEKHMHEKCVQKANELLSHGMIWMDEYGFLLKPLEPGRLMTKYYLKFDTMKHIIQTPENCSLEDALYTICRSEEIAWIQLRRNEKKLLNDINIDKEGHLRFHILGDNGKRKKRIQTREEKIFVLANDCLTGDPFCHDLSLNQDMNSICSNGCRVSKCMKEYFIDKKNYKGVLNSSLLAKCLHHRIWENSPYLLRQLTGIGMVTAKALNLAGINSFETLVEADPRQIEIVTGRKYPFGNHIKESLSSLPPKIDMKVEEIESRRQGKAKLVVTLARLSQSASSVKRHCADMVIGLEEDNLILFREKIRVEEFSSPYSTTVLVSSPQRGTLTVKADLIFEEYIGLDLHEKLLLEKKIDSNMIHKNGNRKSSFSYDLPEDVYVVDDDDQNTTKAQTEEPHSSVTSNKDLMPSFELLDEDMDEGIPAFETEDEGHETLSEKTIFDHIRRKSKDYPLLEALNTIDSPASNTFITPRKRPCGNQIEILSDETETKLIQRETIILSDSEPEEPIRHSYDTDLDTALKYNTISRNSGSSNSLEKDMNEECPVSGTEEKIFEAVNEETIFDHIQKKSKNLPAFSTLNVEKFEPMMLAREQFHKENYTFQNVVEVSEGNGSNIPRKTGMSPYSDPEEMEKHVYVTNECAEAKCHAFRSGLSDETEKPCLSSGMSGAATDVAELKAPSSYVLSGKEDICFSDRGQTALQLKSSGNGLNTQSCTRDAIGETRGVVSFLGFKSVFSFL